jgi:mannosyltransferase OCH1-like enzyme
MIIKTFLIIIVILLLIYVLFTYEIEPFESNHFPKILHHIFWDFTDKNRPITEITEFNECRKTWLNYHKNWSAKLWDKPDMDKFVKKHFPQYFDKWDSLNKKIKKVDMFRYMVLHVEGGLYSDLDMECLINYDNLLEEHKNYDIIFYCHGTEKQEICNNGIMISKPNNGLWIEMIEHGLKNKDKDVLSCTGPPVLGKKAFKNSKKYNIKMLDHYYDKIIQNNGDAAKFKCHMTNEKLKKEKEIKYKDWAKKGYHIGNFHGTPKDIHWLNVSHFTNYTPPKISNLESSKNLNTNSTRKILLTQLYNPNDSFRLKEILDCLKINVNNDNIDEIHLFVENKNDYELINNIDKKKIKFVLTNNRLKYKTVFDYTNNLNKSDIYILSNSDIYFDDTLKNLDNLNFNNLFLSLTRINETVNKKNNFKHQPNSAGSQDVWIWKGKLNISDDKIYNNDGITMGIGGCDLKLNYIIENSGYNLKNYCKLVNCFHKHFYGDLIHNNKNQKVYTEPYGRIKCEDLN